MPRDLTLYLGTLRTKDTGSIDRVVSVPDSHQYDTASNGLLLTYGVGQNLTTDSRRSIIRYTTKKGYVLNTHRSNLCVHERSRTFYGSGVDPVRTDQTSPGHDSYYLDSNHHVTSAACHAVAINQANAHPDLPSARGISFLLANGRSLLAQAIQEMSPDLKELSLPNFLLELDDIPSLLTTWRDNLNIAKIKFGRKGNARGVVSKITRDDWLALNFGLKPLLGDAQSIANSLLLSREKLRLFKSTIGHLQQRHKRYLNESINVSGEFTALPETRTFWRATYNRRCSVYLVYGFAYPAVLNNLDEQLRALSSSFGFELNPRIIWDAIPFSFVVDWFLNVGGFLDQFKVSALKIPVTFVDCFLQFHDEMNIESKTTITYNRSDFSPWITSGSWTTNSRTFHRLPLLPSPEDIVPLGWKCPTLKQASLLVALLPALKGAVRNLRV